MIGANRNPSISGDSAESAPPSSVIGADNSGTTVNNSLQLTDHKLNGRNYLEWAQTVKLVIDGKGKLGHLTGEIKKTSR